MTLVSLRPLRELSAQEIRQWSQLAARAAEPNPFQDPAFVLPLTREITAGRPLKFLSVMESESRRLIAACVVESCEPTFTRPLPHLRSLATPYTFCDSPLIDREYLRVGVRALWESLSHQRSWHGVRFRFVRTSGPQAEAIQEYCSASQVAVLHDRQWDRASTAISELRSKTLLERASKSRRKSLNRARRWLQSQGDVTHRLVFPDAADSRPVDAFLRLESLGWKGVAGTAIGSSPRDVDFFREMIRKFAATRAVCFGELLVGGRVIASTCNLLAGDTLFGFKLGWDPEFADGNPGHWAEIELAQAICDQRPDIATIDSCSQPGSYVEAVSTGAHPMASSVHVWSRRAQVLCGIRRAVQTLKTTLARGGESEAAAGQGR